MVQASAGLVQCPLAKGGTVILKLVVGLFVLFLVLVSIAALYYEW